MRVIYKGDATDLQVKWGGNDDPRICLGTDYAYNVVKQEVHSWHTKYVLREWPNKKFNSCHFTEV